MALGSAGGRAAGVEGNPGTVLTDILSARARLNRDVSEGRPPIRVRFEGVITFVDPALEACFLQDEDAGIYLFFTNHTIPAVSVKQRFRVMEGRLKPGRYTPFVEVEAGEPGGIAKLPIARDAASEHFLAGHEDSQWIRTHGRVLWGGMTNAHQCLRLEASGGRFTAIFPQNLDQPLPTNWIGEDVKIRGVAKTLTNKRGQLTGVQLLVPSIEDVDPDVLTNRSNPFSDDSKAVGDLLAFRGTSNDTEPLRVPVVGVVTLVRSDWRVFIQQGANGGLGLLIIPFSNHHKADMPFFIDQV